MSSPACASAFTTAAKRASKRTRGSVATAVCSTHVCSTTASGYGFPAKLSAPRNFRNPGAFDYRAYLRENGIAALASTKSASVDVLPGFSGNRVELWRSRIHRSIIEKIHALWPPREAGADGRHGDRRRRLHQPSNPHGLPTLRHLPRVGGLGDEREHSRPGNVLVPAAGARWRSDCGVIRLH